MKAWLTATQQQLSTQIQQGILPHALLISGMANAGKQTLSQWLIKTIACQQPLANNDNFLAPCQQCKTCQLISSQTYPDHQVVQASTSTIGVDDIRQATQFFEKTAQIGQVKTLIIESAEKMTIAAANALLKTLEEPSGDSVIVLLTQDIESLLATIISRCRLISLRPPMGQALSEQLNCQLEGDFTNLTHMPELVDEQVKAQYQQFSQSFIHYLLHQQDRAELLSQLNSSPYALRWLEKIVVNFAREQVGWLKSSETDNNALLEPQVLWQVHRLFISMNKRIKTLSQSNLSFEFEKFLVDVKQLTASK
ncbi:DNA polymerase III subunit delta' [Thalassotalea sp. PLHSN55]|uniref:DNA polymerase III subunit delta' n=1 Tax=Thalassotalea sp. PLHSN55 TaxID=3435888 RepID=UPI003F848DDC